MFDIPLEGQVAFYGKCFQEPHDIHQRRLDGLCVPIFTHPNMSVSGIPKRLAVVRASCANPIGMALLRICVERRNAIAGELGNLSGVIEALAVAEGHPPPSESPGGSINQ